MVTALAGMGSSSKSPSDPDVPQVSSQLYTTVFTDPREMIQVLGAQLESRAKESNIVYSHAYKLASQMWSGEPTDIAPDQYWIACYSRQNQTTTLELVLSCTEGSLGAYPIFIYSHRAPSNGTLSPPHLSACVSALATALYDLVPATRVFSVFSLTRITHAFSAAWTTLTDNIYPIIPNPWYSATSSYCTTETFRGARVETGVTSGHVMRKATIEDLDQCANLCEVFAKTGPPFELSLSQARKEAEGMIRANQLWVYELPSNASNVSSPNESNMGGRATDTAIATIVAVTRSTPTVSAITKVYTDAAYRNRGYAERLVAHVTSELLRNPTSGVGRHPQLEAQMLQTSGKQQSVVLYVGHTLDATRVYRRVGFVGLGREEGSSSVCHDAKDEGVEDWLELGFEGASLGHW
jgi:ribosomal protein S18 acetylase RimI-like enzyme